MIDLESIQHKLSSDYNLNIYFSRRFPYIYGPSFSPYKPLQNANFSKVGNIKFFFRNCTHILTRPHWKKFEDTFLVKIASKGTPLKTCLQPCLKLYCKSESKRYGKRIANSFANHCTHCTNGRESRTHFNFYNSCLQELELSDKYTWGNAGDLKQRSMDQTLIEDNRSDYEAVFSYDNACF